MMKRTFKATTALQKPLFYANLIKRAFSGSHKFFLHFLDFYPIDIVGRRSWQEVVVKQKSPSQDFVGHPKLCFQAH